MTGMECWLEVNHLVFMLLIWTVYFFICMDVCEVSSDYLPLEISNWNMSNYLA